MCGDLKIDTTIFKSSIDLPHQLLSFYSGANIPHWELALSLVTIWKGYGYIRHEQPLVISSTDTTIAEGILDKMVATAGIA